MFREQETLISHYWNNCPMVIGIKGGVKKSQHIPNILEGGGNFSLGALSEPPR